MKVLSVLLPLTLLIAAAPALADQHWSGHLQRPVFANDSHGTKFWNHTGYTLSCHFWPIDDGWYWGGNNWCDGGGVADFDTNNCPVTVCPAYSLVARDDQDHEWCIGEGQHEVLSYDHVDLWFYMNSPWDGFSHNSGHMRVAYDCQPAVE